MKVKIQGFARANHSWSLCHWNIARSLKKFGHRVHLVPTDWEANDHIPIDLKSNVRNKPEGIYNCQISYTAMINFRSYLSSGDKNRFGIWNYEYLNKRKGSGLQGFAKHVKFCDYFLPSSNFSKEVFESIGVPPEKMVVVPHGIHIEEFNSAKPYPLKTNKKHKILLNIAQPHKRKAIHLALESFGKAFNKNDDVCLVAKVSVNNKTKHNFNVDFYSLLKDFKKKYPNHAEIELVTHFIINIGDIYKACDINFSATHAECWHLPSIEAIACGLINVVPRYGGQLHFCNDNNSLLIDGQIKRAPKDHLYWHSSPYMSHFVIDTDDAAEKLKYSVENLEQLKENFKDNMKETAKEFSWDNAVKKIISLCEECKI